VGRWRAPAPPADVHIDRWRVDGFDRDREVATRGGAVSERRVEHRS
jgi:hypothetical protein